MKNFISFLDFSSSELNQLVESAINLKSKGIKQNLQGKTIGLIFLSPSLRTRVSFEAAIFKLGGHAIVLNQDSSSWGIEFNEGAIMNSDKAEHIKEAARVLSRYCDCIGVRSFAKLENLAEDEKDQIINSFRAYSSVPVINLESSFEHPCQALADMMTIKEKMGETKGKKFTLSWAPHVKALPLAVPHSAILAAANLGMEITITHPPGYELNEKFTSSCKNIRINKDQNEACNEADILYVKSWGAPKFYGNSELQANDFSEKQNWCISNKHLGEKTLLMHCLPVRRNVVIKDEALDNKQSVVIDQAENRLWTEAAILENLL